MRVVRCVLTSLFPRTSMKDFSPKFYMHELMKYVQCNPLCVYDEISPTIFNGAYTVNMFRLHRAVT